MFSTSWVVWFHLNSVKDWGIDSYHKLHTISNPTDFWMFFNVLPALTNGSMFIMREGVPPIWEDPKNRNGGAWTVFINDTQGIELFTRLSSLMVLDSLINENCREINGISITPKHKSFSIKIWNVDHTKRTTFNEEARLYSVLYKKHI